MAHQRMFTLLAALPSIAAFTRHPQVIENSLPSYASAQLYAAPKSWVTQGLTDEIEMGSLTEAGQGDSMPQNGLRIGRVHVVCAGMPEADVAAATAGCDGVVRLGNSMSGWGTGCHPTTRLCVEFLSEELVGGETVLDYGTGRYGILLKSDHCSHELEFKEFAELFFVWKSALCLKSFLGANYEVR